MELAGKVALVTGAGSGIGKATAFRLAKEGARVGALSDTKEEVDRTAREIEAAGGEAISLFADVGDEAAIRRATDELVGRYGRLDIVIANAGINGMQAPIDELKPAEWDETIRTNLRGSYLTLHYAVPHLKKIGAGAIVLVSSINGNRTFSNAGSTAYSCTKAAQVAMAKQQAFELAEHRIRVNTIGPTFIETPMTRPFFADPAFKERVVSKIKLGRLGTVEDLMGALVFLASDASALMTGSALVVDGGWTAD